MWSEAALTKDLEGRSIEKLREFKRVVDGYKADGKARVNHRGIPVTIETFLEVCNKLIVEKTLSKVDLKKDPQPFRGGLQFVAGGHVFPRDKYRPKKIDMFIPPYSHRHGNTRCEVCGLTFCPFCHPNWLTEKCPGPEDIWPVTKEVVLL